MGWGDIKLYVCNDYFYSEENSVSGFFTFASHLLKDSRSAISVSKLV